MERYQRLLFPPMLGGGAAVGLLILRVIVGFAFVQHGYPKIQHPASWMTLAMGPRAFAPAWLQAIVAAVEFGGGIALMLGLLTPLAALLLACDMIGAMLTVELPSGAAFVGGRHSYELNAVYVAVMAALLFVGPGFVSVDRWLGGAVRRAQDVRGAGRPTHWR